MFENKKIVVVLPAYNAEQTLQKTFSELPHSIIDQIVLTDDGSTDRTATLAQSLNIDTLMHASNQGYGSNQKTCYHQALSHQADIIVMVHPDYQYSPKLVTAMVSMIASGHYDLVLASRILGGHARSSGMPLYKYFANRVLTATQNLACRAKLSEYHTGFRAYSRLFLETIPWEKNSDHFTFDNQIIVQALFFGFRIGEISCPTRYFSEASSISFAPSVLYGLGVLKSTYQYCLQKTGVAKFPIFNQRSNCKKRRY